MSKNYFLTVIIFILSPAVFGQITQLQVGKKDYTEIRLSDVNGSDNIPEGYYETGDTLYFVLKPKGDYSISKGDYKDFSDIRIDQSKIITNQSRKHGYYDNTKDLKRVLLVYPRANVDITKPFEFVFGEYRSDILAIPEKYWPNYLEFTQYYDMGKQLMDKQKYIASFQQFKNIISESQHAFEFNKFSNYNRVYNDYVPEITRAYQTQQSDKLTKLKNDLGNLESISIKQLEAVGIARDSVEMVKEIFDPFYRITEQTSTDLRMAHESLLENYNTFYKQMHENWKKSVLSAIESGNYQGENKFEVYVELLARMLVYTTKVSVISKYDSIDVTLVSNPDRETPFLKKYIDVLNTMEIENWKSEFITIIKLLNDNIKINNMLVSPTVLLNLRGMVTYENQPNYYIINAFDELVKGQFFAFRDNINKAIEKCSDKEMMYYLELWLFSERFKNKEVNPSFIEVVNKGLEFQAKGMPPEAIEQFEKAGRLGKSALPDFLIGRLKKDNMNDVFAAERYLNDAIQSYPDFALARIYHIEIQVENEQYKQALSEIEAVLNMPSLKIWYIYFLKAKVLLSMENYQGALHIITTNCDPLNSKNFDQYILLGDIYLAMKDCEKAKENYQSAGTINPDNSDFSESMKKFVEKCNN